MATTNDSSIQHIDRLTNLPQELFDNVAQELNTDPHGSDSLRLAGKITRAMCHETYSTNFVSLAIMPCYERSLNTALTIVQHPDFGQKVRNLAIIVDEVNVMKAGYHKKQAQEQLRLSRRDIMYLINILNNLKARGPLDTVDFIQRDTNYFSGVICGSHSKKPPATHNLPAHKHAFCIMIQALAQTNTRVENMTTYTLANWALPVHTLSQTQVKANCANVLSNLKWLNITTWCDPAQRLPAQMFAQCFSAATHLETLCVRSIENTTYLVNVNRKFGKNDVDDIVFVNESLRQVFPRLKNLKVTGGKIGLRQIVGFVKEHQERSLEKVILCFLTIVAPPGTEVEEDLKEEDDVEAVLRKMTGFEGDIDVEGVEWIEV